MVVDPARPSTALVLQGGGALGAYQAGVYQALHEAEREPDWVAGVSMGSINGAIIAGNPRERRLERLRAFWETVTARSIWPATPDGDDPRRLLNTWSAFLTLSLGQPGFFTPNLPNPWLSLRGSHTSTSFYDSTPLRETLMQLVDFGLLNHGTMRFAAGAVNVENGNFRYFDSAETEIVPEHVIASGALPPALPMVRVGTDWYWDGGLVSNTPLQHLLERGRDADLLVFQVDLFSARGALPRDMYEVLSRQKDIQYSSRTRLVSDMYAQRLRQNRLLKSVLDKVPEASLTDEERALKQRFAYQPSVTIIQLIYQQNAYENQAKDYEFSNISMREHWDAGYRDTQRTLRHKEWLAMPTDGSGIALHDVHRLDD